MNLRTLAMLALTGMIVVPAQSQDNSAYLDAFMADFNGASEKLLQLAEAFSEEQYAWRPADGIRSVSEVFVHVSNANIGLSAAIGFTHEMDRPDNAEAEITSKADVVADLKMGQTHVREAVKMLMEADLTEEISAFGMMMSRYQVLMILGGHSHEHLGQAIAYARSNGVAPPWSGGGDG